MSDSSVAVVEPVKQSVRPKPQPRYNVILWNDNAHSYAYVIAMLMELFGHLFGKKTPPLVTRYSVWLIGRKCFFSPEKAREKLGWQPTVGYEEGIELAVRWSLDHEAS